MKSNKDFMRVLLWCVVVVNTSFFTSSFAQYSGTSEAVAPVDIEIIVDRFDQTRKMLSVTLTAIANSDEVDIDMDILFPTFLEKLSGEAIQNVRIANGRSQSVTFELKVNELTSFKIKGSVLGRKNTNIKISEVGFLFFYYDGHEFKYSRNPNDIRALQKPSITQHGEQQPNIFNLIESYLTDAQGNPIEQELDNNQKLKKLNDLSAMQRSIRVHGRIRYTDGDGSAQNVRYAKVVIKDEGSLGSLGTTTTDGSGNFSHSINSNESNGPDIYIEVYTEGANGAPSGSNGIASVQDDILHTTYFLSTSDNPIRNVTSSEVEINLQGSSGGTNYGGFAVYDGFVEGWIKSKQYLSINIDKITVYWPAGDGSVTFQVLWTDWINIRQDARFERDVILHEYGHYINNEYDLINAKGGAHGWGVNMTGLRENPESSIDFRRYSREEAVRLAMSEGWATFFSISLQYPQTNDSYYDAYTERTLQIHAPLELNNYRDADDEAAVCGILWDIYDSSDETVESHDNLNESLLSIWQVLESGSKIDSVQQFADKWQDLNKGHLFELSNIYSHFGIIPTATQPTQLNVDIALVIDRSGSMGPDFFNYIGPAKTVASNLVGHLNIGDNIAVVSFHGESDIEFPLNSIVSDATKALAQNAISDIQIPLRANWIGTSIGTGLQEGRNELNKGNTQETQVMILLSDGEENRAPYVDSVLPTLPENTKIYTVALGASAGQATLRDIAGQTGGFYFFAPDTAYMPQALPPKLGFSRGKVPPSPL